MKILWEKEGTMWKVLFKADTIDPSGMSVVGNFNKWKIKDATPFSSGSNELTLLIPETFNELSFKFYDSVYDCWCEVYDNGELYSGLEPYFVRNEIGTANIVIPLLTNELPPKKVVRKKVSSGLEENSKLKTKSKSKKKSS
jgi:hypothetical protein